MPEVVARYVAALNDHDPDAVAACVADDFTNRHASELGRPTDGRAAYRDALPRFFADVPGLHYAVQETVASAGGSPVAVAYRLTADGGIDVPGVWWLVLRDGLLASRTDYWDSATVLRQRGG